MTDAELLNGQVQISWQTQRVRSGRIRDRRRQKRKANQKAKEKRKKKIKRKRRRRRRKGRRSKKKKKKKARENGKRSQQKRTENEKMQDLERQNKKNKQKQHETAACRVPPAACRQPLPSHPARASCSRAQCAIRARTAVKRRLGLWGHASSVELRGKALQTLQVKRHVGHLVLSKLRRSPVAHMCVDSHACIAHAFQNKKQLAVALCTRCNPFGHSCCTTSHPKVSECGKNDVATRRLGMSSLPLINDAAVGAGNACLF